MAKKKTEKTNPYPEVIFSNYPLEERENMLDANADAVEIETYSKSLTTDEIDQAQGEYAKVAIEIQAKEEELAVLKLQYSTFLKPSKARMKNMLNTIRTGQYSITDKVYRMADHSAGIMHNYDKHGNKISTRRLLPHEAQTSLREHV